MKIRNIIKGAIIGTGAVVGAVLGPPLYALGASIAKTYRSTANFMIKRPHAATAAMVATAVLTYGACQHREYVKRQAMRATAHAVEQYRYSLQAPSPGQAPSRLEETIEQAEQDAEAFTEAEGVNYYFVKPGDTLAGIAKHINGDAGTHEDILAYNGIDDPRAVPAGMLLRIPERLCTRRVRDVYRRVPKLEQTILTGTRISDAFPERWSEILALNHEIGLEYNDDYEGTRIVYSD